LVNLVLNTAVHFFAMHADVFWRRDAKAHLITANSQYGNLDVVADNQGFAETSGQYQHVLLPPTKGF